MLARNIDGQTEVVAWIRRADTVWIVTESEEIVIGPDAWKQAWADLNARGFVESIPNDQQEMTAGVDRVFDLVRSAFRPVTHGNDVDLRQGQGVDGDADERTLASILIVLKTNRMDAAPFCHAVNFVAVNLFSVPCVTMRQRRIAEYSWRPAWFPETRLPGPDCA